MKTQILLFSVFAMACVESEPTWEPSDSVTISSGVYGQTVARCPEVGTPCVVEAAPNVAVAAYVGPDLPAEGTQPLEVVVSDERGFFEISLETGTYRLCRSDQLPHGVFVPSSCTGTAWSVSGATRVDMY